MRFSILLLMFIGSVLLPVTSQAAPLEKVSIQLKWFHQFQFAGYYAAKEKGFYAKEGLDVNLIQRNPKQGYIDAVVEGKAEYGVADAGLLLARVKESPLFCWLRYFNTPRLYFYP